MNGDERCGAEKTRNSRYCNRCARRESFHPPGSPSQEVPTDEEVFHAADTSTAGGDETRAPAVASPVAAPPLVRLGAQELRALAKDRFVSKFVRC